VSSVLDVNAGDWEKEVLKSDVLTIVDFWHEKCPWCKRLEPIYREVAEEYESRVKFTRLNVFASHENQHIAMHYGVMSTPTLILFCDGRPIVGTVGAPAKDRLKQLVEETLNNHKECLKKSTQLKTD